MEQIEGLVDKTLNYMLIGGFGFPAAILLFSAILGLVGIPMDGKVIVEKIPMIVLGGAVMGIILGFLFWSHLVTHRINDLIHNTPKKKKK